MIYSTSSHFESSDFCTARNKQYDAIIIGGGTSGLVTALTLIEKNKTVAIIEAGSFSFPTHLTNTEYRFQYPLIRAARKQHEYNQNLSDGTNFGPNISCLGGRGMFWNGASPRYQISDLVGWPISYEDLIPYYEWIEEQFRVSSVAGESSLAKKIIKNIRDHSNLNAVPAPFAYNDSKFHNGMMPSGVSSGLALFFRNTTEDSKAESYDIFTNSFATEIIYNKTQATGVKVRFNNNSEELILNARAVILGAGGIESAKLLSNSNIADPYSRIGVGIQEHLFYRSFWNGSHLYDHNLRESGAVFIPAIDQSSAQVEIHAPGGFLFATDNDTPWVPADSPHFEIMMRSFAATRKTDKNMVTFEKKSIGGSNVTFTHTNYEQELKIKMKDTLADIGKLLNLTIIKDGYAPIGGSYHEAGGLDMGNCPQTSVTDLNGRVHTMDNIYVVDASAFPQIGAANPHLTIGAIARMKALSIEI